MTLGHYEIILRQAKKMHVHQVALGGGNPNQHPLFAEILQLTREKYGIVPNYTTNGRGLDENVLRATSRYCGAVAVSAYKPYSETAEAVGRLRNYNVTVNIHFILNSKSVDTAIEWLKSPPDFLTDINALIFLNYKPVGRLSSTSLLLKNSSCVREFFQLACTRKYPFRIGFDTCTVTGLARYTNIPEVSYEACDAGRFSMFISEDMKMYPCSFMTKDFEGILVTEDNIHTYWQNGREFKQIRETLGSPRCPSCTHRSLCLGGCPIWPEINLCP
jgi:radical SAM protein with 4Fe4S-binding SPASM domain